MMKAYVLIEAIVGKSGEVAEYVQKLAEVKSADSVIGPYDVVAVVEATDLDTVGSVVKQIHSISGVYKTTTLIAVKF
ncbi:MAG: hypothetical protein DDT22_00781 [candidate division WS2 bacterium]|nr:hypothetical protein [Candidatus Lithacetigena glycinireducens]